MIWAKIVEIVSLDCVSTTDFQKGSPEIRGQLLFPVVLDECDFVPKSWNHSFVYPVWRPSITSSPRSHVRSPLSGCGRTSNTWGERKALTTPRRFWQ